MFRGLWFILRKVIVEFCTFSVRFKLSFRWALLHLWIDSELEELLHLTHSWTVLYRTCHLPSGNGDNGFMVVNSLSQGIVLLISAFVTAPPIHRATLCCSYCLNGIVTSTKVYPHWHLNRDIVPHGNVNAAMGMSMGIQCCNTDHRDYFIANSELMLWG